MQRRLALVTAIAIATTAQSGVVERVPPQLWINKYLPEKLEKIETRAYDKPIDIARKQAFSGRYKTALITLSTITNADPVEMSLVRAMALAPLGRLDEALEVLSTPQVADEPRVQLARVRILEALGRYDDALQLVHAHLAKNPASIQAHYLLGELSERVGDLATARSAYDWVNQPPQSFYEKWTAQQERGFDNAADVVAMAASLDRSATLEGQYQNHQQLHDDILNMFVKVYDEIDRTYWPARVAAARYLSDHDDDDGALKTLGAALEQNPGAMDGMALAAHIYLEKYNFDGALSIIDSMRAIDPDSVDADLLEATVQIRQRRADVATTILNRVLARQPKNLNAQGLLAAAAMVHLDQPQVDRIIAGIEKLDPDNATAFSEIGQAMLTCNDSDRAVLWLTKAVDRAPWWASARNNLGVAYMEDAQEDKARAMLESAYSVDPYNIKTVNYLRLLDDMKGFKRFETQHFIFVYAPIDDPIVPLYIAPFMESAYREVCDRFKFEPPWKSKVEVFPDAEEFSVRTEGLPGLETFGASLGKVMTVVAPRAGKTLGPFHFARVLKHEFTHTVNLAATNGRCPRWLTEGLAVSSENVEYRFAWVPHVMYDRATQGKLFTIAELPNALIHPRDPRDGEVAYMEGFWITQFIEQKLGHDAILHLLDAYKSGTGDNASFQAALSMSVSEFEAQFFPWAKDKVAKWGYDADTMKSCQELQTKADGLMKGRQFDDAAKVWQEASTAQPMNPLPHRRLAGLYLLLKRPADATAHLEAINPLEIKDNRYSKELARLYRAQNDLEMAKKSAMNAIYVNPYDPGAHDLLAEIVEKMGDKTTADQERKVSADLTAKQAAAKAKDQQQQHNSGDDDAK